MIIVNLKHILIELKYKIELTLLVQFNKINKIIKILRINNINKVNKIMKK